MTNIKFGIIGCGRIAQRHAEHINNTQGCELVATCDIFPEKSKELGDKYNAMFYDNVAEFLTNEEIEVVSICSPNGLHAEHSIASLLAGKHVLCEKPMAISAYDCGEMIKAAEKTNKRLFVIKQTDTILRLLL
jgi:UDP-N-acetyl-2-amino-2-deoxyglucuronate dehydrogenase